MIMLIKSSFFLRINWIQSIFKHYLRGKMQGSFRRRFRLEFSKAGWKKVMHTARKDRPREMIRTAVYGCNLIETSRKSRCVEKIGCYFSLYGVGLFSPDDQMLHAWNMLTVKCTIDGPIITKMVAKNHFHFLENEFLDFREAKHFFYFCSWETLFLMDIFNPVCCWRLCFPTSFSV